MGSQKFLVPRGPPLQSWGMVGPIKYYPSYLVWSRCKILLLLCHAMSLGHKIWGCWGLRFVERISSLATRLSLHIGYDAECGCSRSDGMRFVRTPKLWIRWDPPLGIGMADPLKLTPVEISLVARVIMTNLFAVGQTIRTNAYGDRPTPETLEPRIPLVKVRKGRRN